MIHPVKEKGNIEPDHTEIKENRCCRPAWAGTGQGSFQDTGQIPALFACLDAGRDEKRLVNKG